MEARKVEQTIKTIERRYRLGLAILEACPERFARAQLVQAAEKHGISREMAGKLRVLADPKVGYKERELEDWYKIFRDKGHALTISHFIKLISVPRGETRKKLTNEAIKQRWSSHELQANILVAQGRRKLGGRRPRAVDSKSVAGRLQQQLFTWGRWLDLHQEAIERCDQELTAKTTKLRKIITTISAELSETVNERVNQSSGQRRATGNVD